MEQKQTDVVIKTLIEKQTTISTMESCTSGLIASMITDTEGASAIFPGGYVTYSNETKMLVGVDEQVHPNNADSVQGKMFFCIRIQNMPYTYEVNTEVTGRSRHEIKQFYADQIFEKLSDLIKNV